MLQIRNNRIHLLILGDILLICTEVVLPRNIRNFAGRPAGADIVGIEGTGDIEDIEDIDQSSVPEASAEDPADYQAIV